MKVTNLPVNSRQCRVSAREVKSGRRPVRHDRYRQKYPALVALYDSLLGTTDDDAADAQHEELRLDDQVARCGTLGVMSW